MLKKKEDKQYVVLNHEMNEVVDIISTAEDLVRYDQRADLSCRFFELGGEVKVQTSIISVDDGGPKPRGEFTDLFDYPYSKKHR